jgi:DNA end-binding protein Ku
MPRSIWKGAISFGLVNVPVKLYSAVSKKTVRFNQLHDADHARIQQKRVCSQDGEEVPYENIVKGFEIGPDRYVVITPDELEALDPAKTRAIDIEDFVDVADIDPLYYEHPYYLLPDTGAAKAYKLLLEALRDTNKVAIARVVLRTKEYLVAIRPAGEVLTMETMLFADELIGTDSLDELPDAEVKATERELSMARQLIEAQATEFDPSKYRDEYRERVLDLIERKAAGEEIAVQPMAEESQEVPDLMAALEQSLAAARGGGRKAPVKTASNGAATAKKSSGSSRTAKKKPAAKGKPAAKRKPAAKKPRAGSRA